MYMYIAIRLSHLKRHHSLAPRYRACLLTPASRFVLIFNLTLSILLLPLHYSWDWSRLKVTPTLSSRWCTTLVATSHTWPDSRTSIGHHSTLPSTLYWGKAHKKQTIKVSGCCSVNLRQCHMQYNYNSMICKYYTIQWEIFRIQF